MEKMEKTFTKIEDDFDTMMSAFGIHGDCTIKYKEIQPEGMNFYGILTCNANIMCRKYVWSLRYWPASKTANDFVAEAKAKLFDMLVEAAKQNL